MVSFDDAELADFGDLDGVQASASYTRTTAVARTGETVLGISLESLASDQTFQWQRWAEGRAPAPGQPEIGLTRHSLEQLHIRLGDLVSIGNPALGAANFRVTGVIDERGSLEYSNAAYGVVSEQTARLLAGVTGANVVLLRVDPGSDVNGVLAGVNEAGHGGFAQTTKELIEGAGSAEQTRLTGIDAVLFSFSPLALVVAAIVLGTSIVVSLGSRRRHLALLRSVGATRSQTFALVLVEVLTLGALGSVVGVLAGIGLARAGLPLTGLIPGLPAVSGAAFTVPVTGAGDRPRRRGAALADQRAPSGLGGEPDPTGRRAVEHDHPLVVAPHGHDRRCVAAGPRAGRRRRRAQRRAHRPGCCSGCSRRSSAPCRRSASPSPCSPNASAPDCATAATPSASWPPTDWPASPVGPRPKAWRSCWPPP